jgi:hypothetical protein
MGFWCSAVPADSLVEWRDFAESVEASTGNMIPVCNADTVVDPVSGVPPFLSFEFALIGSSFRPNMCMQLAGNPWVGGCHQWNNLPRPGTAYRRITPLSALAFALPTRWGPRNLAIPFSLFGDCHANLPLARFLYR